MAILLFFITALCSIVSPYILYQDPKTWFEAQAFCRQYHSDLATITNTPALNSLMSQISGSGFAWIGMFDDMTKWKWSEHNIDINSTHFTNWAPSNPNYQPSATELQVCVRMLTGGLWDDDNCAAVGPKVCFDDVAGPTFLNAPNTWFDSQSYCIINHRDLATVRDMNENTLIDEEISKDSWIGLYRHSWTNWSDSTFSTFARWDPNMNLHINTSATFHCAMVDLQTGNWFRGSCNSPIPFICNGEVTGDSSSSSGTKGIFKPGYASRFKLRLQTEANLDDSDIQMQFLEKINAKLEEQGLSEFKLRWTQVKKQSVAKEKEKRGPCTNPI